MRTELRPLELRASVLAKKALRENLEVPDPAEARDRMLQQQQRALQAIKRAREARKPR